MFDAYKTSIGLNEIEHIIFNIGINLYNYFLFFSVKCTHQYLLLFLYFTYDKLYNYYYYKLLLATRRRAHIGVRPEVMTR